MTDAEYEKEKLRIKTFLYRWIDQLGMKWFRNDVEYNRLRKEDSPYAVAEAVYSNWMYRDFEIRFYLPASINLTDDELEDTIVHELVHCLTAPIACNMKGTDVNDQYRRDLVEQTTDIITKAILWAYEAGQDSVKELKNNGEENMPDLENVPEKESTYGEKAVGLSFNPSGDENVHKAKQLSAELIDLAHNTATPEDSRFLNGLRTAAVNAVIAAQMMVVKLITWKE